MLSEILKKLRAAKGVTQDNMAEMLNIKRQTYSAYERGVSVPDISSIIKIADYFNVTVDYLLERSNDHSVQSVPLNSVFEIVRIYVGLSDTNKQKVLEYAEMLEEKEKKEAK